MSMIFRAIFLWGFCIVFITSTLPITLAEDSEIDVIRIGPLIDAEEAYGLSLSPNGEYFAWFDREVGVCFYSISDDTQICHDAEWPLSFQEWVHVLQLEWSPDSQKVIITFDTFMLQYLRQKMRLMGRKCEQQRVER